MRRLLPVLLAALAMLMAGGCAGARVEVTAKQSRYAISMSQAVRDGSGRLYDYHSLDRVGTLHAGRTRVGLLYSAVTIFSTIDISEDVNAQVAAAGGEAVVGLAVSVGDGCEGLNMFPVLNILPIWPGCAPVTVTGDIVRRRSSP
jgi:hypothetical protein